jgi:oxalate---CoA ligase
MDVIPVLETLRLRAAEMPDAPAILAPGRPPATFAALAAHAANLSRSLAGAGLGRNSILAAVLPDDATTLCGFLGACPATAFAPLNPELREAEFESAFEDLRPSALLVAAGSSSGSVAAAGTMGIPVLEAQPNPEGQAGLFSVCPSSAPAAPAMEPQPSAPALLLQTSATTGRAKFACLTHANLAAIVETATSSTLLNRDDRMLNILPLFHLQGLGAAFLQLLLGGSAVCAWPFDVRRFLTSMKDFGPTWYSAVPSLHRAILALLRENPDVKNGLRLRFVRSVGSPLPAELLAELEEALRVPVVEGYGLTEAGMVTSTPIRPYRPKPGSAGVRITPGMEIANDIGNIVPAGREGEIVLRGPNVISDYRVGGQAVAVTQGEGWFRTGDLGRFDNEGYLFVTGRKKEMINRGGEKIVPAEIDDALRAHPAVKEAAVFALEHPLLGEEVAAAVVLRDGEAAGQTALRDFLSTRLASFKIPTVWVFTDRLPRGASSKVQRWRLAQDYAQAHRIRQVLPGPPLTEEQAKLAEIWATVLDIPAPGIDEDFFDLGGHSLASVQILGRIKRSLGVTLPYDALLSQPTIRRLAAMLRDSETIRSRIVAIQPDGSKRPFFMVRPLPIFRPLGSRLGIDRPFLGIVLPGPKELDAGGADLQEIASQLVSAVRVRQPFGPYYLGGWSADGVLAFEMAQQLKAAGEDIALLALFDTPNPTRLGMQPLRRSLAFQVRMWQWRVRFQVASIRRLGRKEAATYVMERIVAGGHLIRNVLRGASAHASIPGSQHPSGIRPRIANYKPQPYSGPVTVFCTGGSNPGAAAYSSGGWEEFARGSLSRVPVPGDHLTMFLEPNVDVLARELQRSMERAENPTSAMAES